MQNKNNMDQDRVFSLDEFKQFERLNQNTNSRIPIFFCIDVSGSMASKVGFFETRLSLLSKVLKKLLESMKTHPYLSERAVIGIVTYNNKAILQQPALDLGILDICKATSFEAANQTIFSLGLNRTLQAIDQYRDSMHRSDTETFTPMLVFMTDGEPVGDDESEIEKIYNEIWDRVQKEDLFVFPIGISLQANMSYVKALSPYRQGYQMIGEDDFDVVFQEIGRIVGDKPDIQVEEGIEITNKVSKLESTKDTGAGVGLGMAHLEKMLGDIKGD